MAFSRGEVVLVPFPDADLQGYKQRPAVIVQSDILVTEYNQQIVAQVTSAPRAGASRVQVPVASPEGKAMGLLTDSSVVLDRLATLDAKTFIKTIGKCPPQTMTLVDDALRKALDL